MMHQVLYNVHVTPFIGQLHNIKHLVHHDMPCDPNLVSSAFYTIPIFQLLPLSCAFFAAFSNYTYIEPHHYNTLLGLVNIRGKGLAKQLYFPGAKVIQVHCSTACALTSTCTDIHTCTPTQLVRTDDIRTERVNKEILPGRKLISMQQIHQLQYYYIFLV